MKIFYLKTFHINNLLGAKALAIASNKIDGFIRVYDETRNLVVFGGKKYDHNYNRIRYLI